MNRKSTLAIPGLTMSLLFGAAFNHARANRGTNDNGLIVNGESPPASAEGLKSANTPATDLAARF